MAILCWLRWLAQGNRGQCLLAIFFALCLPMIKLEGAVWLLLLVAVMLLGRLSRRWRWMVLAVLVATAAIGIAFGGIRLPIFGLGWIDVAWGRVTIPALGELDLYWRPVGAAMLSGLLTLPNWHLLWYLAPLVVVLRWRVFATDRSARSLGALLVGCTLFLFILFFFTDASAWAENYTSANRLVLHIVPVVFSLMALLLADVRVSDVDRSKELPEPIEPE
jgi:hypothetical protein